MAPLYARAGHSPRSADRISAPILAYHRRVTLHDDHGDLPSHAEVLLRRLDGLAGFFAPARVAHHQHMMHAERCRVLGDHLRGVLALSSAGHYAGAFVVTRTALEHHLLDRLLFLASRWIEEERGIKRANVPAEDARLTALKAGPRPDIVRWWYDSASGAMNVLIRGLFKEGSVGRGATLSPYYFWVDRYDPFAVKKKLSSRLATGFRDLDADNKWADESVREWYRHFTYKQLRNNLDVNHLLRPRLGVQVDVHHAFLSAYVHGAQMAYELVYGHNIPSNVGVFDHYASELALLYVVAIAAAELEAFGRMAKRVPRLRLLEWPTVEAEVAAARASSGHFWFLSGEPHMYDRIQELDTRVPMQARSSPRTRARVDPASLDPSRVRYYINPLQRIIKLHSSYQELVTGRTFRSPFERPDARFR